MSEERHSVSKHRTQLRFVARTDLDGTSFYKCVELTISIVTWQGSMHVRSLEKQTLFKALRPPLIIALIGTFPTSLSPITRKLSVFE